MLLGLPVALTEAIRPPNKFEDVGLVRQSLQQGSRHPFIPKDRSPIRETQVGRDMLPIIQ